MSVLMVDLEVFNYVRSGIEKAAYNTTVNDFYFYSVQTYFDNKDIQAEAIRLVKSWCKMNEQSYCIRYKETNDNLHEFIKITFTHKPITSIQFIKYLQAILYNIEAEAVKEEDKPDLILLERILSDAQAAYINNLEEYKKANWSN